MYKVVAENAVDFRDFPIGPPGWGSRGEDLLSAENTYLSGQFAQRWELRTMAREAALREAAKSKLRRLVAHNKSFNCARVKFGDSTRGRETKGHA